MNQSAGLFLPDAVGPGQTKEEFIHSKWDTFDEMELILAQAGFAPVEKPIFSQPRLTTEVLTTPDSHRYSEIYLQIEAWHNYAYNYKSRLQALQVGFENEMNEIERDVRTTAMAATRAKKLSAIALKDTVEANPRYGELKIEHQKLEQQRLLMQSHVDSLERDLKLVSRQVEIRRQDIDAGRIGGGVATRGKYA
jgi:hypothetical protein